jgi:hypothetical protein
VSRWTEGACPHGQYREGCLDCKYEDRQRAASVPVQAVAPHTDDPRGTSRLRQAQREFLRRAERDVELGTDDLQRRIDRFIKEA